MFSFFQLIVEHCEVPIKSVELQLVRVETCGCAEGYARDGKQNLWVIFIVIIICSRIIFVICNTQSIFLNSVYLESVHTGA